MGWYFVFFFLSGFCSILYELVWLRLTMAQFGVTTALVSLTLSVFMLGLGIGSWGAGMIMRSFSDRIRFSPLRLYALAELIIGCSSLAVPAELQWAHHLLQSLTRQSAWSSGMYYLASGGLVAVIIVPWCICMGATYPLAMSAIRRDISSESRRSFSFLYLANVVGAVAGAIVPLFLIESYGFHGTLRIGSVLNGIIALASFSLSFVKRELITTTGAEEDAPAARAQSAGKGALVLLFLTGLATMGMEVIWIRLYTPYLGPVVYAFAAILACYLIATFIGSILYRDASRTRDPDTQLKWVSLSLWGLLPLLATDPRVAHFAKEHTGLGVLGQVWMGIFLFALVVGFLTPMLVDRWSGGDPHRAGQAYAVNVLGCIVGPLLSGFFLLPIFGEHWSMLLYVLPWMLMAFLRSKSTKVNLGRRIAAYAMVAAALVVFLATRDYETIYGQRKVLRDSTATVIATGSNMSRKLVTNGVGMTALTPVTKMMAHLTLSSLDQPPRNALVICFGMGTTYRSIASWGIPETAVELVPSVPRLFSYYHDDAGRVLSNPLSQIVIDDGRRFMERSPEKFDVIIIDPPPPIEAAASSLLYSEEFYSVAKLRLKGGGILAQWLPKGDVAVQASVARAVKESFPYVRVFRSVEGWGWHFLASMQPIPIRSETELLARMPAAAVADMMEWGPEKTPGSQLHRILSTEMTSETMIAGSPQTPALHDDLPTNEYFLLRALRAKNEAVGKQ
jgi:spermidine synthase/MFS family permease